MLTFTNQLDAALRLEGSTPFYAARIHAPLQADLDFSSVSPGDVVSIYPRVDGVVHSIELTEGLDWSRGMSGVQAAESFYSAVKAALNPYSDPVLGVRPIWRGGPIVVIVAHQRATNLSIVGVPNYVRGGPRVISQRVLEDAEPCLGEVSFTASEIDAVTREGSYPKCDLTVDRSFWREIARYSRGAAWGVEVYLGADGVDFGDFALVFVGQTRTPRANADSTFTIECLHLIEAQNDVLGFDAYHWRACRPLDQLLVALESANLDSLFLTSSLDSDADPIRSHFVVSRGSRFDEKKIPLTYYNNNDYTKDTAEPLRAEFYAQREDDWQEEPIDATQSLLSIMHEFAMMLRGCWRLDVDGLIEFVQYDQDASPVASFDGEKDISGLEPVSQTENLINQVTIDSLKGRAFELNDYESQSEIGQVKPLSVQLPWVQGRFPWVRDDNDYLIAAPGYQTTTIIRPGTVLGGICGMLIEPTAGYALLNDVAGAPDGVNNGRYTYLRLSDYDRDDSYPLQEIVAIGKAQYNNAIAKPIVGGYGEYADIVDGENRYIARLEDPSRGFTWQAYKAELVLAAAGSSGLDFGRFSYRGRAGFWDIYQPAGFLPNGPSHDTRYEIADASVRKCFGLAQDVTIPIYVARDILARFKFGADVVRFRVPVWFASLQVGDVAVIENDDLIIIGDMDGADASATWEVTSVRLPSGSWEVEVELTLLKQEYTYGAAVAIPPDPVIYYPPSGTANQVVVGADDVVIGADSVVVTE